MNLPKEQAVFPCSPRGSPAAEYRGPDSETSPRSPRVSFLERSSPGTRRPSHGVLTIFPAESLGHVQRSPHGMPRGVFDLLRESSRSPRSPHAPHGILTASLWRSFPSSAQSFTMSSPRVFEACSTPPAFVTFVNPAAFIASTANPERRPERQ